MNKWCGIQKSNKTNKYRVVIPLGGCDNIVSDDMMLEGCIGGKILTKWLSLNEAKEACKEFNMLHEKYN